MIMPLLNQKMSRGSENSVMSVEIITVSHPTFEDQLACLSDQNMFASDIKDWSKDIGRCILYKNITPGC